jgi:hypothetical protein
MGKEDDFICMEVTEPDNISMVASERHGGANPVSYRSHNQSAKAN